MKEVVSPLEEIPTVVELDAPQPGELVPLIFGAERMVDSRCREDHSRANKSSDEAVVLPNDGIQDGRAKSGHKAGKKDRAAGFRDVLYRFSRFGCVTPRDCGRMRGGSYDSQASSQISRASKAAVAQIG